MNKNFIFKKGMHAGKTFAEVEQKFPSYIKWAKENAPNLLKEKAPTKPKEINKNLTIENEKIPNSLQPNLDFLNQKSEKNI